MKSIIFDVDGVIVDVRESYHLAIKETAEHYLGRSIPLDLIKEIKYSRAINNDWDVTLTVIRELGGEADYEELVEVFTKKYDQLKYREKLLLDRDFFRQLRDSGTPLGIVTGRPRRDLLFIFQRFELSQFFDCTVDEDHIKDPVFRKPHPYPLKLCMEKLGSRSSLYVGDNTADLKMVNEAKKIYALDVDFVHFKKVVDLKLDSLFSTDNEDELLNFLLQWASPNREEVREYRP